MIGAAVGSLLALMVQPDVSANAQFDCQASARIGEAGMDEALCGLDVFDGELVYGAETGEQAGLGPVPRVPAIPGGFQTETLWVKSRGASYIVGTTADGMSRAAMLARSPENGEWRREDITCGEPYGAEHVFGFSEDARYAVLAWSHADYDSFCRLDFETMTQTSESVHEFRSQADFREMQLSWWEDGRFVVRRPGGDEIYRNFQAVSEACGRTNGNRRPYTGDSNGLCGVEYDGGNLFLSHHWVGEAPAQPSPEEIEMVGEPEFWVVREADSAIFGVEFGGETSMTAIGRDGAYAWTTEDFRCGEQGRFGHALGFYEEARYAVVINPAASDYNTLDENGDFIDAHLVCVFDFATMSSTSTWFAADMGDASYSDLALDWTAADDFVLRMPAASGLPQDPTDDGAYAEEYELFYHYRPGSQ